MVTLLPMSNPSETWWGVLLDGAIGAGFGAVATAAAVWLTLRYERNRVREQALDDASVRLAAHANRLFPAVAGKRLNDRTTRDAYAEVLAAGAEATVRASARHSEYGRVLEDLTKRLVADMAAFADSRWRNESLHSQILIDLNAIRATAWRWTKSPKDFRGGRLDADGMLALAGPDDPT